MIEQQESFQVISPEVGAPVLPLVFDSPHSGTVCPRDMDTIAPEQALKTSWDAYVDELWSGITKVGGSLVMARFHRAYIDANRSLLDIDPDLLSEPWPAPLEPSERTSRGMGLIRRYALPGVSMYARKLPVAEVEHRIKHYYEPYHAVLRRLLDEAHARFHRVWHIDCHSMKSVGNAMNIDSGSSRADMVVSDRDGTSSDPLLTRWIAECLEALGYRVTINSPYRGGEIVRKYGDPASGRHSIQIEINRRLYMDEKTFEKTAGFHTLKRNLETLMLQLANRLSAQ